MSEEQGLTPYETREILFYKTENGEVRVEILLFSGKPLADTGKNGRTVRGTESGLSKHLKNIFESGELSEGFSCFQNGNNCGGRETVSDQLYNLDAIIAVGYRVNSKKATMFRIWANRVLKEFIIKGYVMDDARLREPRTFSQGLFRGTAGAYPGHPASEERFYQKITDIYSQCSARLRCGKAPSQRSFSPRCRTSSTMRSPIIPPLRSYMAVPTAPSPTWA